MRLKTTRLLTKLILAILLITLTVVGCRLVPPDPPPKTMPDWVPEAPMPNASEKLQADMDRFSQACLDDARQRVTRASFEDGSFVDQVTTVKEQLDQHPVGSKPWREAWREWAVLQIGRLLIVIEDNSDLKDHEIRSRQSIIDRFIIDIAICEKRYPVARGMLAQRLIERLDGVGGDHARSQKEFDRVQAMLLLEDRDGLIAMQHWHIAYQRAINERRPEDQRMSPTKLNEYLARHHMTIAELESNGNALARWARVWIEPYPHTLGGDLSSRNESDPLSYLYRWSAVWQAGVLEAPEEEQARARQDFLICVEECWARRVRNHSTGSSRDQTRTRMLREADLSVCVEAMKEKYKAWGGGPDRVHPSHTQAQTDAVRRQYNARLAWMDTLLDENPAADIEAFLAMRDAELAFTIAFNEPGSAYIERKRNQNEIERRMLLFDFEWLLQHELDKQKERYRDRGPGEDLHYSWRVQDARLAGDIDLLLKLKRERYPEMPEYLESLEGLDKKQRRILASQYADVAIAAINNNDIKSYNLVVDQMMRQGLEVFGLGNPRWPVKDR